MNDQQNIIAKSQGCRVILKDIKHQFGKNKVKLFDKISLGRLSIGKLSAKCPRFFKTKKFLKIHMKRIHPEVSFQCDLCAKFVKIKNDLVKHIQIHIKKFSQKNL